MVEPVRSPPKPKGLGPERREEILAEALRLFGQFGLHGVSTRQIAAAIGISQPTLYAYFRSKHDIAAELQTRAFDELHARLVAGLGDLGAKAAFARCLRIYIDFGLENPDAYRVAFMLEDPLGRLRRPDEGEVPAGGKKAFGVLQSSIHELHARGLARADDPELLAQSIWAAMHGLVALLLARPGFPWVEREALIEGHVRLLADAAMTDPLPSPR